VQHVEANPSVGRLRTRDRAAGAVRGAGRRYATAFSGSGTLQKAAVDDLSTSFKDVRTLNGFGTLQVSCDPTSETEDQVVFRLNNTTSSTIVVTGFDELDGSFEGTSEVGPMSAGGNSATETGGVVRLHLAKFADGNKAQVDITGNSRGISDDNCDDEQVRILALNTQE
jgi:hypothetical protein